jgi:hypothetical protein
MSDSTGNITWEVIHITKINIQHTIFRQLNVMHEDDA